MLLPFGRWADGERRRDAEFKTLTGRVERSIGNSIVAPSLPHQVTDVLTDALADLFGAPATRSGVAALSVTDRWWLMTSLAGLLGADRQWITATCDDCGERFDAFVDLNALPVREPDHIVAEVSVETSAGRCIVRPPTGADQEAASETEAADAFDDLLDRCVRVEDENRPASTLLSGDDIAAVEDALEACFPQPVVDVAANCPECGRQNPIELDPYVVLSFGSEALLEDVHRLAVAYHWSEEEIVSLPRERRLAYLALVAGLEEAS